LRLVLVIISLSLERKKERKKERNLSKIEREDKMKAFEETTFSTIRQKGKNEDRSCNELLVPSRRTINDSRTTLT